MKNDRNNPQQDKNKSQGQGNKDQSQRGDPRNLGQENTSEREDQIGENAGGNFGPGASMSGDQDQRNQGRMESDQGRNRDMEDDSDETRTEEERNERNESRQDR